MLLKFIEPLVHSAYCVNQNLPTNSGFGQRNADNIIIIAYTVGLYYLKPVRCRFQRLPCYTTAGHICILNHISLWYIARLSIFAQNYWTKVELHDLQNNNTKLYTTNYKFVIKLQCTCEFHYINMYSIM